MSTPGSFNRQISVEECDEMQSRFEAGESVPVIAADVAYTRKTVRNHATDECKHLDTTKGTSDRGCPCCGAEDVHLRSHLPCEGVGDV